MPQKRIVKLLKNTQWSWRYKKNKPTFCQRNAVLDLPKISPDFSRRTVASP